MTRRMRGGDPGGRRSKHEGGTWISIRSYSRVQFAFADSARSATPDVLLVRNVR
jgi:hypothetical protein